MAHLFELQDDIPVLKLLERWSGDVNGYAVGAEPMATHTWHINQVVLGPECHTIEELERLVAKIRIDLDALVAAAKVRIAASQS